MIGNSGEESTGLTSSNSVHKLASVQDMAQDTYRLEETSISAITASATPPQPPSSAAKTPDRSTDHRK